MRGEDADPAPGGSGRPEIIEVLEPNWPAVQVYQLCAWTRIGVSTMERWRVVRTDIAATEILANCALLRIPRSQWPEIPWRVHHMARIAAPILNREK